jgi:hypothetical protein
MEPKHWDPHTAREILAAFFNEHALHTITGVRFTNLYVEFVCSCGSAKRKVYEVEIITRGWSLAKVRYGLRNVPAISVT